MPAYAYEEDLFDMVEGPETVTASDIEQCDSGRRLQQWMDDFEVQADNIRAQLDAARCTGFDNDGWVFRASRALAYVNIACGRIRRRMKEIGWTSRSQEGRIQYLERDLQTKKAEAAYGRAFVELARQQLPANEFARLDREAVAKIEAK